MTKEKDDIIDECGTKNVDDCNGKQNLDRSEASMRKVGPRKPIAQHPSSADENPKKDDVQEASEESFPASDPPSWNPTHS